MPEITDYPVRCKRCGLPIHRVRVRVGRSVPIIVGRDEEYGGTLKYRKEEPHYEVGWRHVVQNVGWKKAVCLKATPPSSKGRSPIGKRGRKRNVRQKIGWEKGKNKDWQEVGNVTLPYSTVPNPTSGFRIG